MTTLESERPRDEEESKAKNEQYSAITSKLPAVPYRFRYQGEYLGTNVQSGAGPAS